MSNIAIEFQNVGKMYRLGRVGTGTLSHDLNRWWQMSVLGKEDPFLKIGQTNDRTQKGTSDYVWALRDISFQVVQGEVLGIIGKNGAGKSTLLKLLSNITSPSTGSIKYQGRIASLLEVGTGFHPEMTGRENIYMNGSIMGMTKQEITRKLDEIVDFAGVERYLDTPVKRYSSGMTVRLGFAVAAFLEPEILVVDEVLTVGDAEFQKKAIGKMDSVANEGGRTVLFVSHNMGSVRALCKNGIVLENGSVSHVGTADECVDYYLASRDFVIKQHSVISPKDRKHERTLEFEYLEVKMLNDARAVATREPLVFEFTIKKNTNKYKKIQVGILINNMSDQRVGICNTEEVDVPDNQDVFRVRVELPYHQLAKGTYSLDFSLISYDSILGFRTYDAVYNVIVFDIVYLDESHTIKIANWASYHGNCSYQNSSILVLSN